MLPADPNVEVHYCSDVGSALRLAHQVRPTVILQDLVMPNVDGFAILRFFRADREVSNVPVIVLSSKEDPRDKSKAFELGASDYLVKIPDKIELLARVRAHSRSYLAHLERDEAFRAIEEMKKQLELQNAELQRLSTTDALTGIHNRRYFDEMLRREWRRGCREHFPVSLIMIDVDFFKKFNDRYGHQAGDDCLHRIGQVVHGVARRPGDVAARFGGEEFVLLLPNTTSDGASVVANNLKMLIGQLAIRHEASEVAPHVTLSQGIAHVRDPAGAATPAALIELADKALYEAKRSGRDRWVIAPDSRKCDLDTLIPDPPPPA
jgi:two-component system chemotaxis family response regulator WspR